MERPEQRLSWALAFLFGLLPLPVQASELVAQNSGDLNYWGKRCYELQTPEPRIQACTRAIALYSKDAGFFGNRALALAALERHVEAIDDFNRAIDIDPSFFGYWHNLAISFNQLEWYEKALSAFDQALTLDDSFGGTWFERGIALGNLGQHEQAVASFGHATRIQPDVPDGWYQKGFALNQLEKYPEALVALDRAIQLAPDFGYAWLERGNTLGGLERFEEVIQSVDHAVALEPNLFVSAALYRGMALSALERNEEALQEFRSAAKQAPQDSWILLQEVFLLNSLGHFNQVVTASKRILDIDSNNAEAWFQKGLALEELEQYSEALGSYDKAIELEPEVEDYQLQRDTLRQKLSLSN